MKNDFGSVLEKLLRDNQEIGVMRLVIMLAQMELNDAAQLLEDLSNWSKEAMDKVLGERHDD